MSFETLLGYSRLFGETALRRKREQSSIDSLDVVALEGRVGNVYTEQVFRHFLEVERVRAVRSGRTFFLVLVSLLRCPERGIRFASGAAASLLQGLGLCVREVDFIGWYRDGRVAGAVLAQGPEEPGADASRHIVERVISVLSERLPKSVTERLRVRIVKLGSQSKQFNSYV
jgi:hypothetical protein